MIFGSAHTVEQYSGNPRVQAHGPGFSKILIGDDVVDQWEDYLDLMVESVLSNSGRSCINCSGIWASRHTKEIGEALASRMGGIEILRELDFLKQVFGEAFDPSQYRMLIFGFAMVLMMLWKPRGLIAHREPSIVYKEKKSIGSDMVQEGHG
jgi:hypothetical protein